MSIHAQLSPKAQTALAAQKRTSTISALIISILSFGLVILILMVIALTVELKKAPEIIAFLPKTALVDEIERPEIKSEVQRKPASPSSNMTKVFSVPTASPTAVPVTNLEITEVAIEFGNGNDFGYGSGDGDGNGLIGDDGFKRLPPIVKDRCSKERRLNRLLANGGSEQCEDAVMKSLRWLQKTQNSDGSWTGKNKGAMTGFALLAFLGHCETPISAEFGETVEKSIVYLVNLGMQNDGRLATAAVGSHHWVYEHGIATYALAEAYTFCDSLGLKIPNLEDVTETAGNMIIAGQTDSGGWLYGYKSGGGGGDNSVGFWQIQALKACKNTKLWEDKDFRIVSGKALEWLTKVQGENGAIGYNSSASRSPGLTGGGILAFQMWDKPKSKEVRAGAKYIRANTDFQWNEPSSDLYYHYYNAQAMINIGGDDWKFYNDLFRDELLTNQNEDGSWKNSNKHSGNLHMSTCLATFMLEVYYRFLPSSSK